MRMRFLVMLLIACSFKNAAAQKEKEFNNGTDRPKLVVGIVIDQMRWDFLYRYYNRYSEGGFKRLINKGFSFENTMIPYSPTVTAAGHTCLYTGAVPAMHGIVGNNWVDEAGNWVYCTDDATVQSVGGAAAPGKMSPRNMLANTIGDELRLATNFKSRVFGVALKDRGGILPAGHSANAAYWFDDVTGNWITSTYYMNALPAWVQSFNAAGAPSKYMAAGWNLLYDSSLYDQSVPGYKSYERAYTGKIKSAFPHALDSRGGKDYNDIRYAPFGNTLTLDFARELIKNEQLGMSGQTDMLCLSLSSTDYIGHRYGPQSMEAEDTYLRLDKDLADFLNMLDKTIGKDKYVVFLSADHGASQSPQYLQDVKQSAGTLQGTTLRTELNASLQAKYKVKNLIRTYTEYQFYLDNKKIDSAGLNSSEVSQFIVNELMKRPEVISAFDYSNFDKVILPAALKERFANGYFAKRTGDIQFILKPQYSDGVPLGTDHGTIYNYDAHIPLLFYGWGIKHGMTNRETYMTDVAPTLAGMLHIQMPGGATGKVLTEALK